MVDDATCESILQPSCHPLGVEELVLENPWPWTTGFLRQLRQARPNAFLGPHLMFGSDYSGDHSESQFHVYGFVIADEAASPEWPARSWLVREKFLRDGRRMSFKNMNDNQRRQALVPFL